MTGRLFPPRFMTDGELRDHFGLTKRALQRLRLTRTFPKKDNMVNKTDRKVVEIFFDRRAGINLSMGTMDYVPVPDGEENFDV